MSPESRAEDENFRRGAEAAAQCVDELVKMYPVTMFPEPPPKQHGRTVDQCSAAMARAVLPPLADRFRALPLPEPEESTEE